MFIALARHTTVHGPQASVICAVEDFPYQVLAAAKHAEELGYRFDQDETGIVVIMIGNGELLWAEEYMPKDNQSSVIYSRLKQKGVWVEQWFDQDLEEQYAGRPLELDLIEVQRRPFAPP